MKPLLPIAALEAIRCGDAPVPLQAIPLPSELQVVVLAPHPDDFDAIAVSLRHLHSLGNAIQVAVLSGGSKGVQDGYADPPTWEHKARLREQEQTASCSLFGLPPARLSFLRLAEADDGELSHQTENETRVRDYVRAVCPDLVFLPYGDDANSGHRRTYLMARAAFKDLGKTVVALYNNDPKTLGFRADLYVGFGEDEGQWKRTLLRCHSSQQARNREVRGYGLDERILRFNRETATSLSLDTPYAEAFQLELFRFDG